MLLLERDCQVSSIGDEVCNLDVISGGKYEWMGAIGIQIVVTRSRSRADSPKRFSNPLVVFFFFFSRRPHTKQKKLSENHHIVGLDA